MQSPSIHAEPSIQTVHMATETKEMINHYGNSHVIIQRLDSEHARRWRGRITEYQYSIWESGIYMKQLDWDNMKYTLPVLTGFLEKLLLRWVHSWNLGEFEILMSEFYLADQPEDKSVTAKSLSSPSPFLSEILWEESKWYLNCCSDMAWIQQKNSTLCL